MNTMTDETARRAIDSTAFGPDADFGGLLQESQPVMLSSIVQSACVRVDEDGTEAAAATAIGYDTGCPWKSPKPCIVRINRPFVFIVHNRRIGVNLFVGRIENPAEDLKGLQSNKGEMKG